MGSAWGVYQQCDERNSESKYTIKDAMGMTITKEIIPTKANLQENDFINFSLLNLKSLFIIRVLMERK